MCEFFKECPSASGWCYGIKTVEPSCMPFIFSSISKLEKENELLQAAVDMLTPLMEDD